MAKLSPCFSRPMRLGMTVTRESGLAPPGRPRPPMRNSRSLTRDSAFGALGEVDHAGSVEGDYDFFGVVVEVLADDEEGFAVAVAVGVGEGDVGSQ